MVICPGCGAGMRFDIPTQRLVCDYCGQTMQVSDAKEGAQAKQEAAGFADASVQEQTGSGEDVMNVTVYTCPQCGGEIYSMDSEATSFCTFCGASVVLQGRMEETARPVHIIPFKKSKEDCKKIYADLTKKAVFTPKELKDPEYLERFRGIYLPFWTYNYSQKGNVRLKGTRETANYTEHLDLTCDLDVTYDGISYDASSAFNDELCSYITPYNSSSMRDFNPAYMAGFYADIPDVESSVYRTDSARDANNETIDRLSAKYPGVEIKKGQDLSKKLHTKLEGVTCALYPVWFLTYRSGDRVAYAVVNGETGKIAADLPVQKSKFLLGSLLLAIPIFLLLSLLPVITAQNQIVIAAFLALGSFAIYLLSSREIKRREARLDDKGYQYRLKEDEKLKAAKKQEAEDSESSAKAPDLGEATKVHNKGRAVYENRILTALRTVLPLLGAVAGILIRLADPVSDIYYYGGSIIIFICICFTLTGLINRFNLLTTRPIPEFHNREGGDDRA